MAIQAFKGVEIGMGFGVADLPGSKVHDEIFFDPTLAFGFDYKAVVWSEAEAARDGGSG